MRRVRRHVSSRWSREKFRHFLFVGLTIGSFRPSLRSFLEQPVVVPPVLLFVVVAYCFFVVTFS